MLDFIVDGTGNRPCDLDVLTVDLFLLVLRRPVDQRSREDGERQRGQYGEEREDDTQGDTALRRHDLTILS